MEKNNSQFQVTPGVIEIPLSGQKLSKETTNLDIINKIGTDLYRDNKDFIREKVNDNWYAVIEPISGDLIASENPLKLYERTQQKYPNRLFYVVGILKNSTINYLYADRT